MRKILGFKFLFAREVSGIATFPGILAASTERQFTQEAITSTGGLMTDVNLHANDTKRQIQFSVPGEDKTRVSV